MKVIKNYHPFEFQLKTIEAAISAIWINRGIYLMDETGLGKTITASTVAVNVAKSILVVCPKSTKSQWELVLGNTDTPFFVTTIRKLPTERNWDCIILDEAHAYGDHKSKTYLSLFEFIHSQPQTPMVMLLSATPVNNNFTEYLNTLALIPFRLNTVPFLMLGNIGGEILTTIKLMDNYERYDEDKPHISYLNEYNENKETLNGLLREFARIVGTFAFRNTRESIRTLYPMDMELMGHFPKITKNTVQYEFGKDVTSAIHQMGYILRQMPLVRQNFNTYCDPKATSGFGGVFKCLLFKRLESSIGALKKTLNNSYAKLEDLNPQFGNEIVIVEGVPHEVNPLFWEHYQLDIKWFKELITLWEPLSDNEKITAFFDTIPKSKTVVFTEYKDTLKLLETRATQLGLRFISHDGDSNEAQLETITKEFDANLAPEEQTNEYDLLLSTDVLSEGSNLHRAAHLFHYDTKWNPSRMIQREGRVNRIMKSGVSTSIEVGSFDFVEIIDTIIDLDGKLQKKSNLATRLLDFTHDPILWGMSIGDFISSMRYEKGDGEYFKKRTVVVKTPLEDLCLQGIQFNQSKAKTVWVNIGEYAPTGEKVSPSAISEFYGRNRTPIPGRPDGGEFQAMVKLVDNPQMFSLYRANHLYSPIFSSLIRNYLKSKQFKEVTEFIKQFLNKNEQKIEFCVLVDKTTI